MPRVTRANNPAKYYFFLVVNAASAVVFGLMAKSTHDAQLALDRLPDYDIQLIPWYAPAIMSLGFVIVLVWAIKAERVV